MVRRGVVVLPRACMDAWTDASTDAWLHAWMHAWLDASVDKCREIIIAALDGCVDG